MHINVVIRKLIREDFKLPYYIYSAEIKKGNDKEVQKIKIAIIGAGRVGVSLRKIF